MRAAALPRGTPAGKGLLATPLRLCWRSRSLPLLPTTLSLLPLLPLLPTLLLQPLRQLWLPQQRLQPQMRRIAVVVEVELQPGQVLVHSNYQLQQQQQQRWWW